MTMKTKAAVLYEQNKGLVVEELDLKEPGPGQVLVKMTAAGICHSDWHAVTGDMPVPMPMAMGHEGAGVVQAVGPGVTHTKPGDHVVLTFIPSCGHCKWCVQGLTMLCDMGAQILAGTLDGGYNLTNKDGQGIGQMCVISTFSEYTIAPAASVCVVDKSYPLDKACLVGCGVATGYGAAVNRAKVTPGSTVLVLGIGGIGMNVVQGAAASSASMIIAADKVDYKLERAKEFGATHTINVDKEDLVAKVTELTNGEGVNFAFEAIGLPTTIGQAFACAGKGSTTVAIGVNPMTAEQVPISPFVLVLYQKSLMGTLYGTSQPQVEIPKLLNLYKVGKLKLDELITKTYTLDQINDAYDDMLAGKNIRGVITF
jgi:S-(hydroxymethyl)glutathione dehydrogenase/alcohol dehydrogenase